MKDDKYTIKLKDDCRFDEESDNEVQLKTLVFNVSKDDLRAAGKN